jgi:hypothetical protein
MPPSHYYKRFLKEFCTQKMRANKTVKKEIEEDYRRWKDLLCSWIGRINSKNDYTTKSNLQV